MIDLLILKFHKIIFLHLDLWKIMFLLEILKFIEFIYHM